MIHITYSQYLAMLAFHVEPRPFLITGPWTVDYLNGHTWQRQLHPIGWSTCFTTHSCQIHLTSLNCGILLILSKQT
jgi:hypothetical protein